MNDETRIDLMDKNALDSIDTCMNMLVPWYLMASYAYYVEDNPLLSDGLYDRICKKLLDNFENVEHIHKECCNKDALKAGSFLGEYPSRIKGAVESLRGTV